MAKLTAKQNMFIQEYLIDLNATQAAIRAGYSPHTAKDMGCQNLAKPNIAEVIQKAMDKRAESVGMTAADVLEGILYIYTKNKEDNPSVAVRALELAGKHQKLFTDRVEVAVTEMPVIHIGK